MNREIKQLDEKEFKAFVRPDNTVDTYALLLEKLAEKINEMIKTLSSLTPQE